MAKDRAISLTGRLYEAPVALIGKQVVLLYHADQPDKVEVRYQQVSYGLLRPVDLHVNARVKRDKNMDMDLYDLSGSDYRGGQLWGKGRPE